MTASPSESSFYGLPEGDGMHSFDDYSPTSWS